MRFLLDESADFPVAAFLTDRGHDVTSIARDYPSALEDDEVLSIAQKEQRILITNDRDFGELVFRQQRPTQASSSSGLAQKIYRQRLRGLNTSSPITPISWSTLLSSPSAVFGYAALRDPNSAHAQPGIYYVHDIARTYRPWVVFSHSAA